MLLLRSICLGGLLTIATNAVSTGRQGYGLVGYGISMYKPPCAYACKASIANPLDCDSDAQTHDMDDMNTTDSGAVVRRMMGMSLEAPTPICYANNELFLQTLAYCISTHCQDVEPWVLERWWVVNVAGRETVQPRPKMSYQDTLDTIVAAPSANVPADEMLETVALVAEDDYISSFNGDHTFEQHETLNSRYGWVSSPHPKLLSH